MPGEFRRMPVLARRGGLTNLPSSARLPKLLRPTGPERAKNQGLIFRTNQNPCLPHESLDPTEFFRLFRCAVVVGHAANFGTFQA